VISILHKMPAEEYAGREQLMVLSAHDLKVAGPQRQFTHSGQCRLSQLSLRTGHSEEQLEVQRLPTCANPGLRVQPHTPL
jgi:hypothetical protein